MKYIFLLISILYIHLSCFAQTQSSCSIAQKLMIEASKIENEKTPKYGNAIRKLYSAQIAARDCSPAKETEVKGRIIHLFEKIEKLRVAAEEAKNNAIKSEAKARMATNNALALFVASEAGKVNPIQGLRLIEKVMPWASDTNSINIIKEANETIFNQSNNHQFQEKRRYTKINGATFSQDSQWLITTDVNFNSKVCSVQTGKYPDFLKDEKNIRYATFSEDGQWLITRDDNDNTKVWSVETGKYYDFLKDEKNILYATFSPDSQWLITRDGNDNYKVWSVQTGKYPDFLKDERHIFYATFSPDSKWLIATDDIDNSKVWSVQTGKYPDFLKDEKNILYATFSPDSQWLITRDVNGYSKVWSVQTGKYPDFLKDEKNISKVNFFKNCKSLCIITKHQVKTYNIATGKLTQWLWLNKVPEQINIIDNRYLYIAVGKAIVKTDLQTQRGNIMSYGDGEELDYEYDEIVEWMKAFGDKYLLPLDEELKKKYAIKD